MKKVYSLLVIAMLPSLCKASVLVPEQCSLENGSAIDRPLNFIKFSFDGAVVLDGNARAFVMHGDEVVATASSIEERNDVVQNRTQGWIIVNFSGECLPLGEEYALHVSAGSVCLQEDNTVTNDELTVAFSVPADMGEAYFDVENEVEVSGKRHLSCSWGHEAMAVGNPEWEVYRDGELVRTYPATVSSDWELGSAFLDFGDLMHFEKGISFSIVLPAGSVCTHREDIMNREASLDFKGSYDEPMKSPQYIQCNLIEHSGLIGEVSFDYSTPISLLPGKPIILSEGNNEDDTIWEAVPSLSKENDVWRVVADFGGIKPQEDKIYSVVVPEGTVVTSDGDIAVNKMQSKEIYGTVSVEEIINGGGAIDYNFRENVITSSDGYFEVYDMSGKCVATAIGKLSTSDFKAGIYLVVTKNCSQKINIR